MKRLIWYAGWEMVAIHVLTGLLFAFVNVLIAWALLPDHWPFALALLPLAVWSWSGFFYEARYVLRASAGMRTKN